MTASLHSSLSYLGPTLCNTKLMSPPEMTATFIHLRQCEAVSTFCARAWKLGTSLRLSKFNLAAATSRARSGFILVNL